MHRLLIPVFAALLLTTACDNHNNIPDQVALAEMAMAEEDVASTRRICDQLTGDSVTRKAIDATEMARLSILYMQLNERTDDHEAVDMAANCYRDAFILNADSARAFYENLTPDNMKYAMALSSIVTSMDNPHRLDILGNDSHEFADSI